MRIRRLFSLAAVAAAALTLGACSVFGLRTGYDQSDYSVVETLSPDIEIRAYGERAAAEVRLPDPDGSADNKAFRLLFDYISGANESQDKLSMTVPVASEKTSRELQMTAPVATQSGEGTTVMRFFLPPGVTAETAPRPTDARIAIVALPAETLAVLRFTGFTGDDKLARRQDELRQALDASDWRIAGKPLAMFYDPPWTLPFLRRNEVAFPVARR